MVDMDELLVVNPDMSEEDVQKLDDSMKLTLALVGLANQKRDGGGITQKDLVAAIWLHQQVNLHRDLLESLLSGAIESDWDEGDQEPKFRSTKSADEVGN